MVEKSTRTYSSHIQLQNREVSDPKMPEKYIADPQPLIDALRAEPGVEAGDCRDDGPVRLKRRNKWHSMSAF
jgi:hypothetical protein